MLVLSRGLGESIVLGEGPDQVVIEVAEILPHKIKLGIEAPRRIAVNREEVQRERDRRRAAAANGG